MGVLNGRRALVTGGGRNFGQAIAEAFAREGANVAVCVRSNQEELRETLRGVEAHGVRGCGILADLADAAAVERLAREALGEFGVIDILVNNAAIRPNIPFLELTLEQWRRVMAVDLEAPFLLARALAPAMMAQRWGRIINLAGMHAYVPHPGRMASNVAKAGLLGLTRSLALELAPYNVLINSVVPGYAETRRSATSAPQNVEEVLVGIPLGRLALPRDVAAMCVFLASEGADHITGQAIHINGGAFMAP